MSGYKEYTNGECPDPFEFDENYPNAFEYEEKIESLMKYNDMDYDEAYRIVEEFDRQFGDDPDFKEN